MAQLLSDPANESRTAEEVAGLLWDALMPAAVAAAKGEVREETRREILDKDSETRRLAVVGQIQWPQGTTRTVVLGPFAAPLRLDSEEKYRQALLRPCTAAREPGRHLAWDTKTGTGRGRFLLAPAFMKPRAAWDFYRGADEVKEEIEEALEHLPPDIGPACLCGYRKQCFRHPEGRSGTD